MQVAEDQRTSYVDFEIEAGRGMVRAASKLAGEAHAEFKAPYSEPERDALRIWLEQAISINRGTSGGVASNLRLDDPRRVGEQLFEALFQPPIYSLYEKSRAIAIDRGMAGLRLKLRLLDDVAALPWELLYDPRDDYLALTPRLSLVRYLEAPVPIRPLGVEGPLHILLIAGAPEGLDLAAEIRNVYEALRDLVAGKQVVLDLLERATIEQIYDATRARPVHIVHYMGHSQAPKPDLPAQLLLSNEAGDSRAVEVDTIWRMLRRADQLRLIWLNSCSSAVGRDAALVGSLTSAAARFVASGVPAVIANQLRISDRAAIIVARALYTNLAQGMPVDVALTEARVKVSVTALESLEWATPVLFMRAPDGMLFQRSAPATSGSVRGPAVLGDTVKGDNITVGDIVTSSGIAIGRGASSQVSSSQLPPTPHVDELLQQQITEKRRRLAQRRLQAARYGISTPPEVAIEIEDLEREIAALQRQIGSGG